MSAAAPSTTTAPLFSTAGSAEQQRASKPQAVERVGNGTSQQPTNGSNLDLLPVILHWFCNPAASKRNHTSRTPQSAADSQSLLPASPQASVQATNPLWGWRGRAEGEAERDRGSSNWRIGVMMDLWAARWKGSSSLLHFYYPIRSDVIAVIHDNPSHFTDLVGSEYWMMIFFFFAKCFVSNQPRNCFSKYVQALALRLPPVPHFE